MQDPPEKEKKQRKRKTASNKHKERFWDKGGVRGERGQEGHLFLL